MKKFAFEFAACLTVLGYLSGATAVAQQTAPPATTESSNAATLALSPAIEIPSFDAIMTDAMSKLTEAANGGDAAAALAVARAMFAEIDPEIQEQGLKYLQIAVDGGSREANMLQGDIYSEGGYGAVPNIAIARAAYEAAIAAGSIDATVSLGRLLLNTDLTEQGQALALDLLKKAANEGSISASNTLGELYLEGRAVKADANMALHYYGLGLISGNNNARFSIAGLLRQGSVSVAANPSAAMQFYESAAQLGDRNAGRAVADMILKGEAVPQNVSQAIQQFTDLAEAGDSSSYIELGDIYAEGDFTTADLKKAITYYESAATMGNSTAFTRLAGLYLEGGVGVTQSNHKALEYYNQAAALGNNGARRQLANFYMSGGIVGADPGRAFDFLDTAARFGDSQATERLAVLYARNEPFPADFEKVKNYLDLSLLMGNTGAVLNVAEAIADGPLARTHRDEAFILLDGAVKSGIPGAAARLAKLQLSGLFPAKGVEGVIAMLNDTALAGDDASARYLLTLYRDGDGLLLPPDPEAADAFLRTVEPVLGIEGAAIERIKLLAVRGENIPTLEAISVEYAKLSRKNAISTLDSLRRVNARGYVYILQERLSETGRYAGANNGTLDSVTIKAFMAECADANAIRECAPGPLTSGTARILADRLWTGPADK